MKLHSPSLGAGRRTLPQRREWRITFAVQSKPHTPAPRAACWNCLTPACVLHYGGQSDSIVSRKSVVLECPAIERDERSGAVPR